MRRTARKYGFEGFSSSLKSPLRMAADGTTACWFSTESMRSHSSPQKKNNFVRSVLKAPGT